ncbi:MAG: GNAT family N-acetyltransferase [Bacteroidia bacterium]|nr:GNAT family N-acetyltransferase [Bacteroidia bacterium]
MKKADVLIRKGTTSDVAATLQLINELAIYEREPDAVVVTEEELREDGFGQNPLYGLLVAEVDQVVVGISLYYYRYSTWKGKCLYLEDLIVTETQRGKGIGQQLFEATLSIAREENCRKMNWQVLDWNEPAIGFYKKYNAHLDDEWINGSIDIKLNQ